MGPRGSLSFAAALTLCACGSSGSPDADAGPPDAALDAAPDAAGPLQPAAPAPPALPILTPCPAGWRDVADDATAPGLVRCDPWPQTGRATCADDEAHFPGTAGCEVVGTPCGDGDWATDLPEDAEIVYAKAGVVGGNGLRDTPFGDLQHAIDIAAARGSILALSKGTFDGQLVLGETVTLWGACTAETILTAPATEDFGMIVRVASGEGATIRNLTIAGDQVGIYAWDLDSPLVVDSVILRAKHAGIYADEGVVVDATNIVVRDTSASDDGRAGFGVALINGAQVTVTRAVFLRNRNVALSATDGENELVVRDTAIVETLPEVASGGGGVGIEVELGAHLVVERVAIEDGSKGGIVGLDEGTLVEATDVSIRDILPAPDSAGDGVVALYGARFMGRRIAVSDCSGAGLKAVEAGTGVEVDDLLVTDTQDVDLGTDLVVGVGAGLATGAVATLHRALLARNIGPAILVTEDCTLTAEDVTVLDTRAEGGGLGMSLAVLQGGSAEVTRFHGAGSTGGAVLAMGSLHLADALVETTARGEFAFDGWGLAVYEDGEVAVERGIFRDHFGAGIFASHGGRFTGRELLVERIGSASETSSGVLAVGDGSNVELTSFVLATADVCGVQLAEGGSIDLHDGEIRDNPIGANVQDPAFDLARIQDGVRYIDNGVPLDTSSLPVPNLVLGP